MNKIANLISNGTIKPEDLVNAKELIERAELVSTGLKACKKTLLFPLGESETPCYNYWDRAGEYNSWGSCTVDGTFSCYCNWGGNHLIGVCKLTDFNEVFMAFENKEFEADLRRFLLEQIEKAK